MDTTATTLLLRHAPLWGLLFLTLALCGCAAKTRVSTGPFYPAPPDPPRLQYLTSLATAEDLRGRSVLRDFLLGADPQRLVKPSSVAFDGGRMLVADGVQDAYVDFDLAGSSVTLHTGATEEKPQGALVAPLAVRVDGDGTRYVTDSGRGKVVVFDREDHLLREIGPAEAFRPIDLVIDGERLFVSNIKGRNVTILDKNSGELLDTIGTGELMWPTTMVQAPDGSLYVLDAGRFTVLRFASNGELLSTYGALGDGLGQFSHPKGIAVDRDGRLYVTDSSFQNLQVYDQEGTLLMFAGGSGPASGLAAPAGITVDYDSAPFFQRYAAPGFQLEYVVAVADQMLRRVNIYGFGRMDGVAYDDGDASVVAAAEP